VVHIVPSGTVKVSSGAVVRAPLTIQVDAGYHVNSNKPADRFLIPLQLTWSPGSIEAAKVDFPKPEQGKYAFSAKPVSVFTGTFNIVTQFKTAPGANPGPATITGKLHYQACNEHTCLTPKTIEVSLPIEILK
jgi:DsbC/DsbD-like thiol-disulfide interchange protein